MPAPTSIAITASAVKRLVKERQMYEKELVEQEKRVEHKQKQFDEEGNSKDENAEYHLKQEKEALKQTQNIFPGLDSKISETVEKLKTEIAAAERDESTADEVSKAKEVLSTCDKTL
ncbi:tubulin binding cofactor A [Zalerion maritima]|uniref:Tubulin-specific chaperone A n=1 Tax=Zalerion maritima TaxID=339359 RepID=A0AAD5WRW7_9PEZI|nr:tubulin binding cofactor A [Zalerion maritima]